MGYINFAHTHTHTHTYIHFFAVRANSSLLLTTEINIKYKRQKKSEIIFIATFDVEFFFTPIFLVNFTKIAKK